MAKAPTHTRLRYVKSKDPDLIIAFLEKLGRRVQIYGSPQYDGSSWFLWFVPSDVGADVLSVDLD